MESCVTFRQRWRISLQYHLTSYFKHLGIVHELTASYTPQQNGIAENFNRPSLNMVLSMMHHMNVPKMFWAEALSTAVYIRNRVTSRSIPSNMTPHHIWMKNTPTVAHLRFFGCKCGYTIPTEKVKMLDFRGTSAIFVGYAENLKAYKLIDKETGKVVVSRDVTFDESPVVDHSSGSDTDHFWIGEESQKTENEQAQVNR